MKKGNNANYVSTGKPNVAGAVFTAPLGTELPTDATTPLSDDWINLGYVSEEGLSNANDLSISSIKEWGGLIVYNSIDEFTDTFSLALIESENVDVLKAVYGDENVTVAADGTIHVKVTSKNPQEKAFIFDLALRNNLAKRIVIADGAVTAREEITYNASDPIAYGVTISAYPDSEGKTHDEYLEGAGDVPSA